jgi:hypothetical protein
MSIETHLVKKNARNITFCNNCNEEIEKGETYHLEEGVEQHLHSLIARKFCYKCYGKYGEKKLLAKEE